MQRSALRAVVLGLTILVTATIAAAGRPTQLELATDARDAMARLHARDSTLKPVLDSLVGYAIFPEIVKSGFAVGGAGGRGEVYEGGRLVGHAKISQGTAGTQVGGQKFVELILFKRKSALSRFKNNRFALSAQATAIVANEGTAAKAKYADGVAIMILPTAGLTAEASVAGQRLKFFPLESE